MNDDQERHGLRRDGDFALRWKEADPLERKYMLDGVGRELMLENDAPAPPLYTERFDDPRLMGQYRDEDFRIEIKEDLLEQSDPHDAVDTYLHEYRHAWQDYEVQKSRGGFAPESELARDRALEQSLDSYVDPSVDERGYREQLAERDAREFASKFTDEIIDPTERERDG